MPFSESDEAKFVGYFQKDANRDIGWTNTSVSEGDAQRQFNVRVPVGEHAEEIKRLGAYLKEKLGIELVEPTSDLKPGQFYAKAPLTEGMAKMVSPGEMPYQLLFHKDDEARLTEFIQSRTEALQASGAMSKVGAMR